MAITRASSDNTVRPDQSNHSSLNWQPSKSRSDISSTCLFYLFNKQNKLNLLISLCFLQPHACIFELVCIDFVTMPNSKGKSYILTILDSSSRHFTAIPCTRDWAIDAARGLYQFFLCRREIPHIVFSDHCTHFTGEVYKQFCAQMSTKLSATKLRKYRVATSHNEQRPLHSMWG